MSASRDNHTTMTEFWEWALFHHYKFLVTPIENHLLNNPNIVPPISIDPKSRLGRRKILHEFYETLDPRHHIIDAQTLVTFDSINADVLSMCGRDRDWDILRGRIIKAIGIEILKKHLGFQGLKSIAKNDIKFVKVTSQNFDLSAYQNEINELYSEENNDRVISNADQQYLLNIIKINKTTKGKVEEIFEDNKVSAVMKDIGTHLRHMELVKFPVPRLDPIFFDQDVRIYSTSATKAVRVAADSSHRRDTITLDLPGDFDAEEIIYQQSLQPSQQQPPLGRSPAPIQSSSSSSSLLSPKRVTTTTTTAATTSATSTPATAVSSTVSPKPSTSVQKPVVFATTAISNNPPKPTATTATAAVHKPTQQEIIMNVRAATSTLNAHSKQKDPLQAALHSSKEVVAVATSQRGAGTVTDAVVTALAAVNIASRTRNQQQQLAQQQEQEEPQTQAVVSAVRSASTRVPAALEMEKRVVNVRGKATTTATTTTTTEAPLISPILTATSPAVTSSSTQQQQQQGRQRRTKYPRVTDSSSSSSYYPQTQPNDEEEEQQQEDDYYDQNGVQEDEGEEEEVQPTIAKSKSTATATKPTTTDDTDEIEDEEDEENKEEGEGDDGSSDSDFGEVRGSTKLRTSGISRKRKTIDSLPKRRGRSSSSSVVNGSRNRGGGRTQTRTKFTAVEDQALMAGVAKYGVGKWKEILEDEEYAEALIIRTNINLKDRYRNILKTQEDNTHSINLGDGNNGNNSVSSSSRNNNNSANEDEEEDEVEE